MTLMSVRSTTSRKGLVAILVEDGGPAVIAVPVTPREGLLLSAGEPTHAPTWIDLLEQACRVLGGEVDAVELDAAADAALLAWCSPGTGPSTACHALRRRRWSRRVP